MTIRLLHSFEMPLCVDGGKQFTDEAALPDVFDAHYFVEHWSGMIENKAAYVLGLFGDDGKIIGAFAWKVVNGGDFSRKQFAIESWWFVLHGHRGSGLRLFYAFEDWCDKNQVDCRLMIHLVNLQPEKLGALYERRGYRHIENVYLKEGP